MSDVPIDLLGVVTKGMNTGVERTGLLYSMNEEKAASASPDIA